LLKRGAIPRLLAQGKHFDKGDARPTCYVRLQSTI
jgi:hypothetical protein